MDLHLTEPGSLAWLQFLQVTVLIAAVGLLAGLVCRRRPHLAYVLWILVLLKCLTPPLWSSPAGIFSWAQASFARSVLAIQASATMPTPGPRQAAEATLEHPNHFAPGDFVSSHDNSASVIDKPGASRPFSVSWTAIFAAV